MFLVFLITFSFIFNRCLFTFIVYKKLEEIKINKTWSQERRQIQLQPVSSSPWSNPLLGPLIYRYIYIEKNVYFVDRRKCLIVYMLFDHRTQLSRRLANFYWKKNVMSIICSYVTIPCKCYGENVWLLCLMIQTILYKLVHGRKSTNIMGKIQQFSKRLVCVIRLIQVLTLKVALIR